MHSYDVYEVQFEKTMSFHGSDPLFRVQSDRPGVDYIEVTDNGVRILFDDEPTILVPWHRVARVTEDSHED